MSNSSTVWLSRNSYRHLASLARVLLTALTLATHVAAAGPATQPAPRKPSELYNVTAVWTLHVTFAPDQWGAMEPNRINRPPFGGPGAGPGVFLAPTFLKDGDQNHDSKLSKDEFHALGEKWFADWDKDNAGRLTPDPLRAGLNAAFAPPAPGSPGAPAPASPQPGIMLQGQQGRRNGLASAMGLEFQYVRADLDFNGQLIKDIAIRHKGNGTWMESMGSVKRSMKIQTDHFVKGQEFAGVSTINLHNCVTDASFMNEVLSHRLFRDAGVPAPRTAYARVFVTVPGKYDRKYFGLYSMVENIDTTFTKEHFAAKGGALFKPVTPFPFTDLGPNWDSYQQTYDPKTKLSAPEKQRLVDFARLVTHADDAEFAAKVPDFVDLDNFARFMAIEVYLSTLDSILSIGQNYYAYLHPKSGQFHFMPWDLDHSFGQFPMIGTQEQREQLSIHHPWRGDIRFLERVYKVQAFRNLYLARLDEFSRTIFKPDRFHQQVDEIAAAIRPAVGEESEVKLRRLNRVAAGQSPDGPGIADAVFGRGRGSLMQARKPIKAFVTARSQSILDQVSGKSQGQTLADFGFGAPPGPGPDRSARGGPGAPGQQRGGGGPGNFLAPAFMTAFDANRDRQLTRDELLQGLDKWFDAWNTDKTGLLTDDQIRAGINKVLTPSRPGSPGGPVLTPLNGPPPREPA